MQLSCLSSGSASGSAAVAGAAEELEAAAAPAGAVVANMTSAWSDAGFAKQKRFASWPQ